MSKDASPAPEANAEVRRDAAARHEAANDGPNPLLVQDGLPAFGAVEARHVEPAVDRMLAEARAAIGRLEAAESPTTDWLVQMERVNESVHDVWGPVEHLNAVVSSPELRAAYNTCLPLITEFQSEVGQNVALYERYRALEDTVPADAGPLAALIEHAVRDFRLAGVALAGPEKQGFRDVMLKLASAQAAFEQNLMDATDAFAYHTTADEDVAGLPAFVLERARSEAAAQGDDGWLLKLDTPTYQAVMAHADSASLRERYYRAWMTRASELGPKPEAWDNCPLIEEILTLRHRAAVLLGFANYGELSLATKMAESTDQVIGFLDDLAARSKRFAERELASLAQFAGRELAPWDMGYYAEKLKQQRFDLDTETLRAYFPLPQVLQGLFELAETLFGLVLTEAPMPSPWHPSVRYFEIENLDGGLVGGLLTDLFARPNKRGGAWMDGCRNRARLGPSLQRPIAHLVANFAPPSGDAPSYLTHFEVQTLFHEFGHCLHHLLTEIDYPSVGGINGVAWDAVELPSQFFENYAWLPEVLTRISRHRETGETLPDEKIDTLIASRRFLSGLAMLRQLEFALFDFHVHTAPAPPDRARVQTILDEVRQRVAVVPAPAFNRFQCSFSHIFGGGYAAGYYSYKWAEVLAADAFSAFEEAGAFDRDTAARFRRSILAVGGSREAMQAFVDFRGRPPELEPLLRQAGIVD